MLGIRCSVVNNGFMYPIPLHVQGSERQVVCVCGGGEECDLTLLLFAIHSATLLTTPATFLHVPGKLA